MRPSVRIPALDTFICEKIGLFENTENKLELISHFVRGDVSANLEISHKEVSLLTHYPIIRAGGGILLLHLSVCNICFTSPMHIFIGPYIAFF